MCRPALLRRRPVIFSVSAPPPQPNANSSLHAAPHFIVSLCPVPFSVREVFCCVSPSCCKRVLIAGRRLGRGNQLKAALHGAAPGPGAAGGPPPRASLQREVASGAVRRSAVCSWGRLFPRLALFFLGHAPARRCCACQPRTSSSHEFCRTASGGHTAIHVLNFAIARYTPARLKTLRRAGAHCTRPPGDFLRVPPALGAHAAGAHAAQQRMDQHREPLQSFSWCVRPTAGKNTKSS
jgi:hypothetical protein